MTLERRVFGRTGLRVTPVGLGGAPFAGVNRALDWDPFTPEGRRAAVATVHYAIDHGINYVDTAPGYGGGNSETIFGQALAQDGYRQRVVVATKCRWTGTAQDVIASSEWSLRRLQTDVIDVLQLHGHAYSEAQVRHIMEAGPLEGLLRLREAGKVRFIGFTGEEPWTLRPLIATRAFDVVQLRYNVIYQEAALHALDEARDAGVAVAVMRPVTSGVLQRIMRALAPDQPVEAIYALALSYVLADSRVHVANVGMRWPHEVDANLAVAGRLPSLDTFDVAAIPRSTLALYRRSDEEAGLAY
jgi:aryl-alcohol dehydrogenase-like predicted oxidoreductase